MILPSYVEISTALQLLHLFLKANGSLKGSMTIPLLAIQGIFPPSITHPTELLMKR